jgi:hypothetical protein
LSDESKFRLPDDAPPEEAAHRNSLGYRLRPVVALFGLIMIAIAVLFGVASSSQSGQSDAAMLFSCGPCHD